MRDWWPELREKIARTLDEWGRSPGNPHDARVEDIPIVVGPIGYDLERRLLGSINGREFCGAPSGNLIVAGISPQGDTTALRFGLRERPWNDELFPDGMWRQAIEKGHLRYAVVDFDEIP